MERDRGDPRAPRTPGRVLSGRRLHAFRGAARGSRGRLGHEGAGWAHFEDGGVSTEPKYEFVWPLGDIVTAVARAGLRLESLSEFPVGEGPRWRYGDLIAEADGLPGRFLLVARKEV